MADVVGIGNPLIDVLCNVDDSFLDKFGLKKGIMHLVDKDKSELIFSSLKDTKISPGDSTANTLAGISLLGGKTVFFGKVGNDEFGKYYEENLRNSNVKPCLAVQQGMTGKVMSLITADTERTMATHLGVACSLNKDEIDEEQIINSKFLHLTGYQLEEPLLKEAALKAMNIARDNDVKVSLDLADPELVKRNLEDIKEIIGQYVSIVFANEEEAKALTGLEPEKAVEWMSGLVDIAIVKVGAKGSIIKTKGGLYNIERFKVEAVDTTGAGDMYAAGFLYALSKGEKVEIAGKIGSYAAAEVVKEIGGRLKQKIDIDFLRKKKNNLKGETKMDEGETYKVKDIKLAEQGKKNIEWAEMQMGSLLKIKERFAAEKPLEGIKVGMALHVTKETAVLVRTLIAGGADVSITGCNPLSTQDDVAAALAEEGVKVYAWKGETKDEYYWCVNKVIEFKPDITIDDGCDLVSEIHTKHPDMIPSIIGGCEETTTGIIRLKAMEKDGALKYPVIAVNDNKTKHLLDNYYGTGQSTLDGVIRASNILIAGKTLVVIGYGDCGKGVAMRAKGLGANVIVCEVTPFNALQAKYDGFRVMKLMDAAKEGEIFISVTGDKHAIPMSAIKQMKDGAILANSGHFDNEIDMKSLNELPKVRVRPYFDRYDVDGKRVFVAGEGRLVNLACAEGHPSAVMSTSFCGQSLAVEYLVKNKGNMPVKVITLPDEIDDNIARLQLESLGVEIDELTEEQKKYL
ncbi:adenosylhomocysteinase, partial [Candidatus Woesearchaeota archaeon]|nr:adenosylhomocysteinase [Candidatus Woesearchaeota archaeon]